MAAKVKKKVNFWEDPTFQAFYNAQIGPGLAGRTSEQNRLNTLQTKTYGAGGALATNKIEEANAQNRLAEEMAMRGRLYGGAYTGPQKGAGTLLQADYTAQRRGINEGYNSQTDPQSLLAQGLKLNANGRVSPLVEGEEMIDPITGKKKKFSFMNDSQAGQQARAAALVQYLAANAKTKV